MPWCPSWTIRLKMSALQLSRIMRHPSDSLSWFLDAKHFSCQCMGSVMSLRSLWGGDLLAFMIIALFNSTFLVLGAAYFHVLDN